MIFLIGIAMWVWNEKATKPQSPAYTPIGNASPSPVVINKKDNTIKNALFVPYWGLSTESIGYSDYTHLLYFGITPSFSGINTQEIGYKRLAEFIEKTPPDIKKLLVVRMTDSSLNFKILENSSLQKPLIAETITLAKQYGFWAVVLDLEVSSLPFDSVIQQINRFVKDFYKASLSENLSFYITLYGDVFYRVRPYDVKYLSDYTDGVFVMAYDFHKSAGNPGPNFPLKGKNQYGYDFQTMMSDYLKSMPPEKITVVFGLFGYDWTVTDKNSTIEQALPLSYLQIQQKFIDNCPFIVCNRTREEDSSESKIDYQDNLFQQHVVWFEDFESIATKKQFLKEKGIHSTALWAYSYF